MLGHTVAVHYVRWQHTVHYIADPLLIAFLYPFLFLATIIN